ncbi:MAG: spore coat protein U domain-containing protein [Stellaceae bacterium]
MAALSKSGISGESPARRRRLFLRPALAFIAALLLPTLPAAASCTGLSFSALPNAVNWRGSIGTGYAVFDGADRVQAVPITVTSTGGTCTYFITATLLGPDTYVNRQLVGGGDSLRFNVYADSTRSTIIRDLPTAGPNDVLVGTFALGGRAVDHPTYYFDIPPLQVVHPGSYETTLMFKLFQGNLISNQLVQSVQVRHRANVYPATEVSLVGAGQPFSRSNLAGTLDLGNVNATKDARVEAGLNMRIRTNTGYAVTLQSQYKGMLRLGETIDEAALPYTLTVNGQTATLGADAVAALPPANTLTGPDGINLPISISLAPAPGQRPPAGVYRDVITISVKPY